MSPLALQFEQTGKQDTGYVAWKVKVEILHDLKMKFIELQL